MEAASVQNNNSTSVILPCEGAFLQGNFREALRLSNQQLREWWQHQPKNENQNPTVPKENSDGSILQLQTPIHLVFSSEENVIDDSSNRQMISLHFDPADRIDRAAAIALQSWYEISKQPSKNSDTNSHRFLQPFMNVYTSMNHKTMSLELYIVWLKFCLTVQKSSLITIELAGEVMHHIRWAKIPQLDTSESKAKDLISDLTLSLFTEWLPLYYGSETELMEDYFRRLQSSSTFAKNTDSLPDCVQLTSRDTAIYMKKAIQLCLQYCNTDDGNYPEWLQESFVHCRKTLQAHLREMYHQKSRQQHHSARMEPSLLLPESTCQLTNGNHINSDPSRSSLLQVRWKDVCSLRTVHDWKCLGKTLSIRTRQILQELADDRPRRAQMLLLLLVVGLGYRWRNNHRHHHRNHGNRSSLAVVKTIWNVFCQRKRNN
jgi:hypothetical protein